MNASTWFVPGRIEVFGKHTDYGGGRSLLAATEQGIRLAGRRTGDAHVTVTSAHGGRHYVDTVVRGMRADFGPPPSGAHIAVTTSLPVAAGLSSSSALVIGLVLVLADIWELSLPTGPDLVEYIAGLERDVGVRGGAEDHAAILLGTRDALLPCRFHPTRPEPAVPWPADQTFVVAVSGVTAEKAGGARERYNRTAGVLEAIEGRGVLLGALLDDPSLVEQCAAELELPAARRLRQFVEESVVIIPAAADAVRCADWRRFGELAERSHVLGREALGNAVPETEALAHRARSLGAVAASPFGAGFGGSVWAVVPTDDARDFAARWWPGETLITRPGGAATRLT